MLSKKILISLLTIGILATVVSTGAWAYFSSSVTSTGNTITTGTLSLALENGGDGKTDDIYFHVDNAKPGDNNILIKQLNVKNTGNIPGKLMVTVANARDDKDVGKYLTIKVGNQIVYEKGRPVEGIIKTSETNGYLLNEYHIIPGVTYTFENDGDQSDVMGDTFTCDIVFRLDSIPS